MGLLLGGVVPGCRSSLVLFRFKHLLCGGDGASGSEEEDEYSIRFIAGGACLYRDTEGPDHHPIYVRCS